MIVIWTFGYATIAIWIFGYNTYSILKYRAILGRGAQCTSWGRSPSDPIPLEYDLNIWPSFDRCTFLSLICPNSFFIVFVISSAECQIVQCCKWNTFSIVTWQIQYISMSRDSFMMCSRVVKVVLKGYWIRRALASARTLCPFPKYSPVFQNTIRIVSEDLDGYCSISEGPDDYCMISGYRDK